MIKIKLDIVNNDFILYSYLFNAETLWRSK